MKRFTLGGGVVIALFLAVPAQLGAQECFKCQDNDQDGPHRFTETGAGAFFSCATGSGCHLEWRQDTCADWHDGCTLLAQEDLDSVEAALRTGELTDLRAAMARFPDARVNLAAASIDIHCQDRLIARVSAVDDGAGWLVEAAPEFELGSGL